MHGEDIGLIYRRNTFRLLSHDIGSYKRMQQERARSGMILEREQPVTAGSPSLLRLVPLGLGISVVPLEPR